MTWALELAAMQRTLAEAVQQPLPLAEDPASSAAAVAIAAGNERLSPVEQVDIYREQFWLRHRDVLADDFGSIAHAVGSDERWEELARSYLARCPSASFSLRDLGDGMVSFLERAAPWSEDRFLADLARVEWAFVEAFDAPSLPPFDPTSIVGVAEEAWPLATLTLDPALQRIQLGSPAHDYRIAVKKDEPASRPEARSCHVAVYRGPELLHCLEIGADAAAMLDELARGTPLGEACERAAAASGIELASFEAKLGGWFAEWTSLGWIRAVAFPGQ